MPPEVSTSLDASLDIEIGKISIWADPDVRQAADVRINQLIILGARPPLIAKWATLLVARVIRCGLSVTETSLAQTIDWVR